MPLKSQTLGADKRAQLRASLETRAAQMREDIGGALHAAGARGTAALPNRRDEVDDDAVADLESSLDAAALERDLRELDEITAALVRLDTAHFGACEECGEPIAWARLAALPQARRCVRCESAFERRSATAPPRSL